MTDDLEIDSFAPAATVAVVGASGGLGSAFVDALASCRSVQTIVQLSRSKERICADKGPWMKLDLEDESAIADAALAVKEAVGELHLVIVATGVLHGGDGFRPEKSWKTLDARALEWAFRLNTIGPALIAKHFLPLLARDRKSVFAALSARVGSIEDNQLGGWYSYRASKAALNMLMKSFSIELARRNPNALCVGLHPGTVATQLSEPFQRGVTPQRLFSPAQSAAYLLAVLEGLTPADSGHCFAWDGQKVPF